MVCVMQDDEFVSTWVANKAVYRTRMALADGGELLIIAPGLKRFGEQPDVDALIRKYGYVRHAAQCWSNIAAQRRHARSGPCHGPPDPRLVRRAVQNHLCSGPSDGAEVESVNFGYADLARRWSRYQPERRRKAGTRRPTASSFFHSHAFGRAVGHAATSCTTAAGVWPHDRRDGLMPLAPALGGPVRRGLFCVKLGGMIDPAPGPRFSRPDLPPARAPNCSLRPAISTACARRSKTGPTRSISG